MGWLSCSGAQSYQSGFVIDYHELNAAKSLRHGLVVDLRDVICYNFSVSPQKD